MILGELITILKAKVDSTSFKQVESSTDKLVKHARTAAKAFAIFKSGKFFVDMVNDVAELGDQTAKTARAIGFNAQALQEYRFAAEQAGLDTNIFDKGLEKLTGRIGQAATGVGEWGKVFGNLGVNIRDGNGDIKDTSVVLEDVSDKLGGLGTDAERTAVLLKLFEEQGPKFANFFALGSEGMADLRKEARELGFVMDDELLKNSEELIDSNNRMRKTFGGLKNLFAVQLVPAFTRTNDKLVEFVKTNRKAISSGIDKFAKGFLDLMTGLGRAFVFVGEKAIELWDSLPDGVKTMAKLIVSGTALLLLLTNPAGLAFAFTLVLDDIRAFQEGAPSLIGDVIDSVSEFLDKLGLVGQVVKSIAIVFKTVFNIIVQEISNAVAMIGLLFDVVTAAVSGDFKDAFLKAKLAGQFILDSRAGVAGSISGAGSEIGDVFSGKGNEDKIAKDLSNRRTDDLERLSGMNDNSTGNTTNVVINAKTNNPDQLARKVGTEVNRANRRNAKTLRTLQPASK